jgi:hypothetical protein
VADYATLLRDHVTLKVRSVDRIFLQAYVPKLQSVGQVCTFLRWQRGFHIPSSAAFGKTGDGYVKDIERFAKEQDIPMIRFEKGESKEERVRPLLRAAAAENGDGRVVLIGMAQEKASVWRSWRAKGQEQVAHPHMEWGRQMVYVNHYYFYMWDPEWGPAFWKTNAYAPFPIWLWLNGHEWAKRQMDKAGIAYEALDNGFLSSADPQALQKRCDQLGSGAVRDFFWRWYWRLPSPLCTKDIEAGYVYEMAFRQFEVSDTVIFDRPQAGRAWFEGVIRDHLDIGRPDQVSLVFQRRISRRTPGSFRTRVITKGVEPILTCYYKSSRLKQYFKEGRGLRTELVIGDTRDFGIGRRVCAKNWNALRAVGDSANLELTLCPAALTPRPAGVGPVVAHQMASGVRDLDQDPGHKVFGVDPLVFRRLPSVMFALAGVDNLLRAWCEAQPGQAHRRAHHVPHQRLEVAPVPGMRMDPVVDGEAASSPRHQQLDPLLAQQSPAPKQPQHHVAEQLLGGSLVRIRHRDPLPAGRPAAARGQGAHVGGGSSPGPRRSGRLPPLRAVTPSPPWPPRPGAPSPSPPRLETALPEAPGGAGSTPAASSGW